MYNKKEIKTLSPSKNYFCHKSLLKDRLENLLVSYAFWLTVITWIYRRITISYTFFHVHIFRASWTAASATKLYEPRLTAQNRFKFISCDFFRFFIFKYLFG